MQCYLRIRYKLYDLVKSHRHVGSHYQSAERDERESVRKGDSSRAKEGGNNRKDRTQEDAEYLRIK